MSKAILRVVSGDRVAEAVEAAGGQTADADIDALNLARRVRDEEQVVVPRRGGASEVDSRHHR